jgi:cell division protein FtsW
MNKHRPNLGLFVGIAALLLIGTALMSSASVVLSQQVTGDPNYYFREHLIALFIGIPVALLGYKLDYKYLRKAAPFLILVSLILLALVFVPGIGMTHGGARRWLTWPITFAPTEIYKLSLVIYLAAWFEKRQGEVKSLIFSTVPFLIILGVTAGLIMLQPDTGTFVTVAGISAAMYVVAGAAISHIVGLGGLAIAGFIFLLKTAPYRMQRFMIFMNPGSDAGGAGYQINQALLAIGTGGLFGLGFGHSRQKFNYLPEASTDSIFAIAAEELGFFLTAAIFLLYIFVAVQGYKVAQKAPDAFSRLVATGITSWIIIQALINIFAMMSLIPLTGVPLPFLSQGSTSTLVLMLASGILLNISKHTEGENRESRLRRRGDWWSYFTGSSRHQSPRTGK